MNKEQFLQALRARLAYLPASETERPIAFYAESIDDRVEDGMTEEAAVAALGSIEDIAREIEAALPPAKRDGIAEQTVPPPQAPPEGGKKKKRKKWPFVLGAALLLVIVLILAYNFAFVRPTRGGFTGTRGGATPLGDTGSKEYSLFMGGIAYITLDEDDADVVVTQSGDSKIHLIYQDDMEIDHYNGRLSMKRKNSVWSFFRWFSGKQRTELQIPHNLVAEITVSSDNGSVTAKTLVVSGGTSFSSSNGDVEVRTLYADKVTLKNSNGKIEASDLSCGALEAKTSNGKISLTDIAAETTLYAKTSNGAVEVGNISAGKSIELRTSNGAVRGTLAGSGGDYRIESKTSNGSNNLPSSWGRGDILLTVETSNGSIDLRFSED